MYAVRAAVSCVINAGSSLLSQAYSTLYGKQTEHITFFDNTTMPENQMLAIAATIDNLHKGDTEHILRRSVDASYQIPQEVKTRFAEHGIIAQNDEVDPNVVKVLQNMELAVFHAIGAGAAARGALIQARFADSQMREHLQVGDVKDAGKHLNSKNKALKEAEAGKITTYEELVRYGWASISTQDEQSAQASPFPTLE